MFVFVYDCVVVSDLLLVEKVEKKGVGMDLVSIGRKWDRYRYEVLTYEVRIARKGAREEKKEKEGKQDVLVKSRVRCFLSSSSLRRFFSVRILFSHISCLVVS